MKATMMRETEGRAAEAAEDVEIGSLRGERESERGQRGLAVESGAAHARAGQEMGDWFQVLGILFGCARNCQQRRNLAGRRKQRQRVRRDGDFGGQRSYQFAVGLNIDVRPRLWRSLRS